MTHAYATAYQAVKTAQVLENHVFEGRDFVDAQIKLAQVAHDTYERLRDAARGMPVSEGLTKAAELMPVCMASLVMRLHETHVDTGAKLAATPEYLADVLDKVASAVLVDEVLTEQLGMLEGATKVAAEQCRLLGREYIMSLIGEIVK